MLKISQWQLLTFLVPGLFYCFFIFSQPVRNSRNQLYSAENTIIHLHWKGIVSKKISDGITVQHLYFEGASLDNDDFLPAYFYVKDLPDNTSQAEAVISQEAYEEFSVSERDFIQSKLADTSKNISNKINIRNVVSIHRKKPVLTVSFVPIRKNKITGKFEKLVSFALSFKETKNVMKGAAGRTYAASSVLSSGDWFKIGVWKDGIYKITYSFLKNSGVDVTAIDPQNVRIYGNGGGMLPVLNSAYRPDDLLENAIFAEGENDGTFDEEDYFLFYGQGPHRWKLNANLFNHQQNLYSDTNYYFITASLGTGKRIGIKPSLTNYTQTVTSFNDYDYYEKDLLNPIRSGREWLGETYGIATEYDFIFSFPHLTPGTPLTLRSSVAGKTTSGQNIFTINANGQNIGNITIDPVSGSYTDIYARLGEGKHTFSSSVATININVGMIKGSSGAQGWLNFLELNARRNLVFSEEQLIFRDLNSIGNGNARFQLSGAGQNVKVWDVSSAAEPRILAGIAGGTTLEFISAVDTLREFIAFDITAAFPVPVFKEKVAVQNLHSSSASDMIIVTHELFKNEAEELASFHREEDGLSVLVATTGQIFNEFSSGRQDVTALKDFLKMFYDRAGNDPALMPKYLLLFGDGSYDFKGRISGNTNFIPAYQSSESLSPTTSYVTDDYYGLLDDNEGENEYDLVDIGIGRLVVKNTEEARQAVAKIKHYYDKKTMGPWRNYLTYIGDDEDGNIHMQQANSVSGKIENNYKTYNVDKIMFDAYRQQVNAGGQRYPDVNAAIDRRMDLGTLMMTYIGHGGELGWAHERILEIGQINKWSNFDNMPLFVTATCEFSRFDDPQRTAAGEYAFLNPGGGAIGLLTTTRLVYSSPNYEIVQAFTDSAFDEINSVMPRLGDILIATKIKSPKNVNSRNFTLLGDPALRLAYPQYNVVTTFTTDTMAALGRVTVKGYVADDNGQKMQDFNGLLYPLVFDKAATINTLNNDNVYWDSLGNTVPLIFRFKSQKNVLFKGKASVKNGDFEYSFIVPKDISYSYGNGRISHYCENGETDASGYYENFIIGGSDSTAAPDNTGPQIQLFLNDEKFVFGGITDENPKLFAKLFDEHGINTSGNGIGHDIIAFLDENTSKSILLNDYYEAEINSYQKGTIRFPLKELAEGRHTLRLKAFDVYNNSGEAVTEFIVAKSAKLALDHVLNYPNPFTTRTSFYFEHNHPGQNLDISIQIFTVSGKLIKSIDSYVFADTFRAGPISWDGRDDFGDKIGKGVYVYKLKVTAPSGQVADVYEKLVVIQ